MQKSLVLLSLPMLLLACHDRDASATSPTSDNNNDPWISPVPTMVTNIAGGAADPVPVYNVQRAVTPIVIDGNLSEFAWARASQINRFNRILNDYDAVSRPTRAKMLWDHENFYFGFACQDPDVWAIFAQEDDPMWSEEVVEVFIDPNGDGENYLELEVNPLNTVVDLRIVAVSPEWNSSKEWDIAGLSTAVDVYGTINDTELDQGWTVEIAIPWTAFADSIDGGGQPAPGETWRLNLYRIERIGGRALKEEINSINDRLGLLNDEREKICANPCDTDSRTTLGEVQRARLTVLENQLEALTTTLQPLAERHHESTEYTAWSETYQRGFHHPARFGVVQFTD